MSAIDDLSAIGGVLAPGTPVAGLPFYEFSATAAAAAGVSASVRLPKKTRRG